jgi:hypothetical protein
LKNDQDRTIKRWIEDARVYEKERGSENDGKRIERQGERERERERERDNEQTARK